MPSPLVSIVTPVRNGEPHLEECIESVLEQTYENWEYLVLNNASTDDSRSIAQRYADRDPRIHVHDTARPLEMLENWNHALRLISHESAYCKVVHADDRLFPECLERMVALGTAHPSVGIVGAFRMKGEAIDPDPASLWFHDHVLDGRAIGRRRLLGGGGIFGSPTTTLIRSDLVRGRSSFYNQQHLHADTEVCLDLLLESDFGFVHEVLTYTRVHDESVTSRHESLGTGMLKRYHLLRTYGPRYLDTREFEERMAEVESGYLAFLARRLLIGDWRSWRHHRNGLRALGHSLGYSRILSEMLRASGRNLARGLAR